MSFGEDLNYYEVIPATLHGSDGSSKSMEDRKTSVLTKTRRGTKVRDQMLQGIALTSVMSKWYASCFILYLEKEKETENWTKLHVGGINDKKEPPG